MLTRPYVTLVLAAAVANAAESYDVTNCGASTVTTVSATEELTVISVDTKGITRSNSANKAFDNATFECASVVSIAGAERGVTAAPDCDFVAGVRENCPELMAQYQLPGLRLPDNRSARSSAKANATVR